MNKPKNNLLRKLKLTLSVLAVLATDNIVAEQLSPEEMKSLEYYDFVDISGWFTYFCHHFNTNTPPFFICQLGSFQTGGSFLPIRIDKETPYECGEGIDTCYTFQWFRVQRNSGSVDLSVLNARFFRDGLDLSGYCQPYPVSVFTLDGQTVRKRTLSGTFAELLLDSDFHSIEPVADWWGAERYDNGLWKTQKWKYYILHYAGKPSSLGANNLDKFPTKADSPRLVSLRKTLLEHFHSKIPEMVKFVFDRDAKGDIVHAFVADSARPLSDGLLLWTSFHWTNQGWEPVPREGLECPSGKIPDSFPLSTSGFFVLCCQNEEPRLVALRNTPKGPVEPFWEKALSNPDILEKTRHFGIPSPDSPPDTWICSIPPSSLAQTLYHKFRDYRIVVRVSVIGLDVVAPLWKSEP
ncbi:MAG: hypothetical protein ACI4QT_05130 [Kiritimatiellia bacterium]